MCRPCWLNYYREVLPALVHRGAGECIIVRGMPLPFFVCVFVCFHVFFLASSVSSSTLVQIPVSDR